MALTVSLYLRHLVDGLQPCTSLGIFARQSAPIEVNESKHAPVREIAVVGDREDRTASLLLIRIEEIPELGRVFTVRSRERNDLISLILPVTENHDAMKVVACL